MSGGLLRVLDLATLFAESPRAVGALLRWPRFSPTAYRMVTRLAAQGLAPRTVIDVGANVGQFAVAVAKLFPAARVESFEPVPESLQRLREAIAGLGRVSAHPVALGERAGRITIHVNRHRHSSSVLRLGARHVQAFPGAQVERAIEVEVSTLDAVFAAGAPPGPVLLKLDVQGYELAVLRGATAFLRHVEHVLLEVSFTPLYEGEPLFPDVQGFLRDRGFAFVRPVGWLCEPRSGEILQMDALFRRMS